MKESAAKPFKGLAALSAYSAGRWATVKAGSNSGHFSVDGCPLSRYFVGSVATASGHVDHSWSVRQGTGTLYSCRRLLSAVRFMVYM